MFNMRWRKILHDIWLYKARTLLIVAAITVGVTAVGVATTSEVVMRRELFASYTASAPPDVILTLPPFPDRLVKTVSRLAEVQTVMAQCVAVADLELGPDRWIALELHAVPDFEAMSINRLTAEPGAIMPPPAGQLLLERSVLSLPDVAIGESARVRTADGVIHDLAIAGLVNDLAPFPTDMNLLALAYVTPETLRSLLPDQSCDCNRLYVVIAAAECQQTGQATRADIQQVVARIAETTVVLGYPVLQVEIPEPGKPILADNINVILLVLLLLGALSLILSSFVIINVTFGLIGQQIPQIGILKSLGGRASQITRLYLQMVFLFGVAAMLISVPLGLWGARLFVIISATNMDFDINAFYLPPRTVLMQGISAFLVPLLVALVPIRNGARLTVREAIRRTGLAEGNTLMSRLLARIRRLPQLLNLALRNIFRNWGRMLMTLGALSLSGAMFISVLGIRQSLLTTMAVSQRVKNYDVELHFSQLYPLARLEREARRVSGVVTVEARVGTTARRVCADGHTSSDFPLIGTLPASDMTQPLMVEGRWLLPDETGALVINADILDLIGPVNMGEELVLRVGGEEQTWQLVGIAGRTFSPHAFITQRDLAHLTGRPGYANQLVIQTSAHSPAFQQTVEEQLKDHFKRMAMPVSYAWSTGPSKQALNTLLDTVIMVLLVMAGLAAVVGGLGLASTLGLNVLERTREIGILRSLGARNGVIRRMVIGEGIVIGLGSFALAVPLSVPLSLTLGRAVGQQLLRYPLDYAFSWPAMWLWFAIIMLIATVASWLPANRAARLTVRETLAYTG